VFQDDYFTSEHDYFVINHSESALRANFRFHVPPYGESQNPPPKSVFFGILGKFPDLGIISKYWGCGHIFTMIPVEPYDVGSHLGLAIP